MLTAPTEEDYVTIQGKKYAILDVHVDCEAAGGPGSEPGEAGQELSELVSVGMVMVASETETVLHLQEFCLEPLVGRLSKVQVESFWSNAKNAAEWASICEHSRPRLAMLEAIRALLKQCTDLGWTLMFYARPVAFDWSTLKQAFTTAGVEIASKRIEMEELSPKQLFDQLCTPYSLAPGQPRPDYYTKDNKTCFPFGFGGATQATDIGQRMAETAFLFGIESFDFRKPLSRLHQRELTHNGLQDALDQAKVWYQYRRLVREWKAMRSALSQFVTASTSDLEASKELQANVIITVADLGKAIHGKEEAICNFLK